MDVPSLPLSRHYTLQAFVQEHVEERETRQSILYIRNLFIKGFNILVQGWLAHVSENYTDINLIMVCGPVDRNVLTLM